MEATTNKNLTLPVTLLEALKAEARRSGESVNTIIRTACRDHLGGKDEPDRTGGRDVDSLSAAEG